MPSRPKKVKRPWVQEAKPFARDRTNEFDYNARPWRKRRLQQLQEEPLCRECLKHDIVTEATVADHIIPIKDGGDPWDKSNLQSLCKKHHDSKSGRERHGTGGMG